MDDSISQRFVEWMRGKVHGAVQPVFDRMQAGSEDMTAQVQAQAARDRAQRQSFLDQRDAALADFGGRMQNFRWPWSAPAPAVQRMGVSGALPQRPRLPVPMHTPSVGVRG